ncbi:TerD family protein [Paraburkholderia sp. A3RO-2L]|jgi:stress response protein SCP2|uniref:TerD family protein n=1 Tax=unclassified Paraburkholderia TaxID=2615204 RepID=UPI003DAA2C9D
MLTLANTAYKVGSREFNILAALLRAGKMVLPAVDLAAPAANLELVLHSQLGLESLGFVYAADALPVLARLSDGQLAHVHKNIQRILKSALGAHQLFAPMYPDFPQQVLDASDRELLANAYMHYQGDWLGIRILPKYAQSKRVPLKMLESMKPTSLAAVGPDAPRAHMVKLLNGNASLSPSNKELLTELLSYFNEHEPDTLVALLGDSANAIPQKEIRAMTGGWLLLRAPVVYETANFSRYVQTPTDLLRLAAAVGATSLVHTVDLTLTTPPRFAKFQRGVRRLFLRLLDGLSAPTALDEMFLRREQWLRLGEALHPGEYQTRYPRAMALFTALRRKEKPLSWAGAVERNIAAKDMVAALPMLKQRPGVFARKLHEVLRKVSTAGAPAILAAFREVADQVSTPVLVQLRHRMACDLGGVTTQMFAPKGGAGRPWVQQSQHEPIGSYLASKVTGIVTEVLHARFAKLSSLGKVYVDPKLSQYNVPFGQRTAQKALRTLARGTRIDLGDASVVRAYLWWNESGLDKNGNPYQIGRTDLDLSCGVFDENLDYVTHCSFTRLRTTGLTHSGDITSAPEGACEFIDIDFAELDPSAAYISLVAFSYTQQSYADMPEAYMGWMARADGESGEIFDARTVRQKVDLTAEGVRVLMGYIDVARRQLVWADAVLPPKCDAFNAVESSTLMTAALGKGILAPVRPNLGDLLADHALARGELVSTPEEADLVLTGELPDEPSKAGQRVISAYDTETLIAEFLS